MTLDDIYGKMDDGWMDTLVGVANREKSEFYRPDQKREKGRFAPEGKHLGPGDPGHPVRPGIITAVPEKMPGDEPEPDVKTTLATMPITNRKPAITGAGHSATVEFVKVGDTKAVWKPDSGQAHSDIRDTIRGRHYQNEVAAYDVAETLGLADLVPVTVERDINGDKGSLQLFLKGAKVAGDVSGNMYDGADNAARAAAFDYLIGNTDRHPANWMITKDGNMKLIDNGLAFPSGFEGFANTRMIDHASGETIPDEVYGWQDKWPQVESALKKRGIPSKAIKGVKARLDDMTSHTTFDELTKGPWQSEARYSPTKTTPSVQSAFTGSDFPSLVHKDEIMDSKGIVHKRADVGMPSKLDWNEIGEVQRNAIRDNMRVKRQQGKSNIAKEEKNIALKLQNAIDWAQKH